MRRRFGKVITELADRDENIIVLVGDIGYRVFDQFREKYPDRFINLGICEQSMIGVSAGMALEGLGYDQEERQAILAYLDEQETIEGAPHLRDEHIEVFDCAFRPQNGQRSIDWMGHLRMMGAVQPFLSGAISKTVNLPETATTEDVMKAYVEGWKLGLKALAVYRDGSKRTQPLNSGIGESSNVTRLDEFRPRRRKLPDERQAFTHKFSIAGHEGYLTIGMHDDGEPGEIFLKMAKEGSTISGLMDTIATMTSIALQYGVPLKALVDKFSHTRFEPSGFTNNPEIPIAKSVTDYVFRYIGNRFIEGEGEQTSKAVTESGTAPAPPLQSVGAVAGGSGAGEEPQTGKSSFINQADAPSCMDCGSIMIRNGACYKCPNCGSTSGCS